LKEREWKVTGWIRELLSFNNNRTIRNPMSKNRSGSESSFKIFKRAMLLYPKNERNMFPG